jgi:hypothetical protein
MKTAKKATTKAYQRTTPKTATTKIVKTEPAPPAANPKGAAMEITIHPTSKLVLVNSSVEARIWEGQNGAGTPVLVFVTRVVPVSDDTDALEAFAEALQEVEKPTEVANAIPPSVAL